MPTKKIPTLMGMNNAAEEHALEVGGQSPRLYLRDAVNVDFSDTGRIQMRPGIARQVETPFRYLWQSPLHKDCFAQIGASWVLVNLADWSHQILCDIGEGEIFHTLLNNLVCVSGDNGIFVYNGAIAQKLTIDTPAAVRLAQSSSGSMNPGSYACAISWLRNGLESAVSELAKVELQTKGGINIHLPLCLDESITHVRLYLSDENGGELRQAEDYPIDQLSISLSRLPELGRAAQFQHLSPMPSGNFLKVWRGRLLVVRRNVLHFSEAMAYHLTDERYNFIQFPQRITFIEPVDGGVWIGQVTHVLFLRGADIREMVIENKASAAPISGSSTLVPSEDMGEASQGGLACAVWLAENGYVIGLPGGALAEPHAGVIQNLTAKRGQSVRFDQKLMAMVS